MSLLKKVVKGAGKLLGGGLKAVSKVLPGPAGGVAGFVGKLISPKEKSSSSPVAASLVKSTGLASSLRGQASQILSKASFNRGVPSISMPAINPPETKLQAKFFGAPPKRLTAGGSVSVGVSGVPDFNTGSQDADSSKRKTSIWLWVGGVSAFLLALILALFSFGRKRKR